MKAGVFMVSILLAAGVLDGVAQAQNYPWCAQYAGRGMGGAMNCGFSTYQQCMATVSGIGGFCIQNNTYRPAAGPHRHRARAQ